MSFDEISECFLQGYKELPVCDDGKVLGMLKHIDVLKYLLENGRLPPFRASEVMSVPIVSIQDDVSVAQAASVMRRGAIHHLVTIDKAGNMTGIISTADVVSMLERDKGRVPFAREKLDLSTIQLKSVITPEVYTVRPGAKLSEVANEMIEKDTSAIVVYDKEPLGLIHVFNLIKSSLPTTEPRFEIVGLDPEDKEFRDDIRREGIKALQKIEQMFAVEGGKLAIKKYSKSGSRAKYSMKFQVTGKERISVEASDWDIFKTLHYVLKEATRIAKEMKSKVKGKKYGLGKLRAFSLKVRSGDISFGGKPIR
jgi:CBS domain-containing protein